jgi:hypothetical protein
MQPPETEAKCFAATAPPELDKRSSKCNTTKITPTSFVDITELIIFLFLSNKSALITSHIYKLNAYRVDLIDRGKCT